MAIHYEALELVDLFLQHGANPTAVTTTCSNVPTSALKLAEDKRHALLTPRVQEAARMQQQRRTAATLMVAVRRFRPESILRVFPRDIVIMIARIAYDHRGVVPIASASTDCSGVPSASSDCSGGGAQFICGIDGIASELDMLMSK